VQEKLQTLCGTAYTQINAQAGLVSNIYQGVETEFVDTAPQQIVQPGLGNSQLGGFLGL
jgi:hypothetical protein